MLIERSYSVGEVRLNIAEGPRSGPLLVLLHGGSGRWQYGFGSIIPDLTERWHVLAVDLPGHGKSGHTPGRYRLQDYAQDILTLLRALPEPTIVFGHSLGAQIALLVAVQLPLRALILGDIPFTNDTLRSALNANRSNLLEWQTLAGRPYGEIVPALEQTPVIWNDPNPRPAVEAFGKDSPWFSEMALNLAQLDPDMLAAVLEFETMHAVLQPYAIFPKLTCPVLILQGDPKFGALLPDHEVDHALALLPQAQHVKFEGIGHALHNEQKEPVLNALLGFLESL